MQNKLSSKAIKPQKNIKFYILKFKDEKRKALL